jgi:hypothetical protein
MKDGEVREGRRILEGAGKKGGEIAPRTRSGSMVVHLAVIQWPRVGI